MVLRWSWGRTLGSADRTLPEWRVADMLDAGASSMAHMNSDSSVAVDLDRRCEARGWRLEQADGCRRQRDQTQQEKGLRSCWGCFAKTEAAHERRQSVVVSRGMLRRPRNQPCRPVPVVPDVARVEEEASAVARIGLVVETFCVPCRHCVIGLAEKDGAPYPPACNLHEGCTRGHWSLGCRDAESSSLAAHFGAPELCVVALHLANIHKESPMGCASLVW